MLTVGSQVAGYRIDGPLGRGGMGVVYEATQLSLNRKVALKLIVPELGQDPALQERFRREGLRQAAIEHPNIVPVYEAGETMDGLFFAMRLIRGPTLKDLIVSRELDAGRTLRILGPVADALDTAHQNGMIHRDIKPQNILIGGRDHPFLADFGLTKALGEQSVTRSGQFVGTLDYVSPEQIRGNSVTARSDIYSLAAVLYEALTGVVPYPKDSEAAVLYAHLSLSPPRISEQRPELPTELDAVVKRAMSKEPNRRYATAVEMMRSAEETFSRRERAAMSRPGPLERPQETGVREPEEKVSTAEIPLPPVVPTRSAADAGATVAAADGAPSLGRAVGSPTARVITEYPRTAQSTDRSPSATSPTEPVPAARRSRVPRRLLPLAAVAALTAALLGYTVGGSNGSEAKTTAAAAGPLRMELPANWQRTPTLPQVPGLTLRSAANFEPTETIGASLLAGTSDGTGATLLPASLERRLERIPGTDDVVELGRVTGYRYRNLRVRGLDVPVTMFVVPLKKRVATIICIGPGRSAAGRECEGAASTLRLSQAEALPLGAREDYAAALAAALRRLDAGRRSGRRSLRQARTPDGQAGAAARLADAYDGVSRALARAPKGPAERSASEDLATQGRNVEDAYERLASAARADDSAAYSSAASSIRQGERRFERLLGQLRPLGYRVR